MDTITQTIEERFNSALEKTAAQGITVAMNVMTCCRSCATEEDLGIPVGGFDTTRFVWHFGGQDNRLVFEDGQPLFEEEDYRVCECYEDTDEYDEDEDGNEVLIREGEGLVKCDLCLNPDPQTRRTPATKVYFNHGGPDLGGATALADAFREEGFNVEWDGTSGQCVIVNLS